MRERMRAIVRDGGYVTPHPLRKRRRSGTKSRPINACHGFRARKFQPAKKEWHRRKLMSRLLVSGAFLR
jgi:hypothetical protein